MLLRVLAGITLCFLLIGSSYAMSYQQAPGVGETQAKVSEEPSLAYSKIDTAKSIELSEELAALRAQNSLMRNHQSDVMAVVLWALTGVMAMTLLLAGFSWFTNFKLYSADKQALRQELDQKMAQVQSSMASSISLSQADLLKQMSDTLNTFLDKTNSRMDELLGRVGVEISSLKDGSSTLSTKLAVAEREIYSLSGELRIVEEKIWELKGIPQNILLTQAQRVEAMVHAGRAASAKIALESMKGTIESFAGNAKVDFSKASVDAVREKVELARDIDPDAVSWILAALDTVPIRDAESSP